MAAFLLTVAEKEGKHIKQAERIRAKSVQIWDEQRRSTGCVVLPQNEVKLNFGSEIKETEICDILMI